MKVNAFSARCITNLHVGNGDVNYNIIDGEVERDPVTGLPIINSSGVKGAIKEFFESQWGKNDQRIKDYFGTGNGINAQGSYKFLQADLLFRPLRVSDNSSRSFVLSTTEEIVAGFADKVNSLNGIIEGIDAFSPCGNSVQVEGEDCAVNLSETGGKWKSITDKKVAVVDNLTRYDLPVIARNVLDDNGNSKNLWYEEFVPHESIFGLIILTPGELDQDFKNILTSEPVQFGGNASIGYGLMLIKEI